MKSRKRYPKYKSSGVQWLGDVPEGWEVIPIRRLAKVINGGTPSSTEASYWDGDLSWITPEDLGDLKDRYIEEGRRSITREGLDNSGARLAPPGSIVLSTRAPIGHLAITTREASTNQGCRTLVPYNNLLDPDYFYFVLNIASNVLQSLGKGTTFLELASGTLAAVKIPAPPLLEQKYISTYLDHQTSKIDQMIEKINKANVLLLEYRSALITSVVTGKVDIREVASS